MQSYSFTLTGYDIWSVERLYIWVICSALICFITSLITNWVGNSVKELNVKLKQVPILYLWGSGKGSYRGTFLLRIPAIQECDMKALLKGYV